MKYPFYLAMYLSGLFNLSAQQNLFNIPSGDLTPKGKFFFQQQINSYSIRDYEFKSHLVYGVGKHLETGINFINTPVRFGRPIEVAYNSNDRFLPVYPALLHTLQTQVKLNSWSRFNLGYMAGINIPVKSRDINFLYKTYGIFNLRVNKYIRTLVGGHFSNPYLVGDRSNIGILAGYEFFLSKKFFLMGDYISGRNNNSALVIGFNYNVTKRFQLCLGGLLATPEGKMKKGLVFEVNLLGYDLDDHH